MRLAKYLAHAGVASRRAAEQLVFAGRVTVGGDVVRDPARDVGEGDAVAVDGSGVSLERRHVVYALNKPAGYVSTAKDPQGRPTVVSLIDSRERLYPVGRLDADTTGLLLLTNDGELAHRLTHPSFEVPRVYRVQVRNAPIREPALRRLREGVVLDDGKTAPAEVRRLTPDRIEIVLHEGRKRQVRRMCEAVGHRVAALERVAFGPLRLGDLPLGRHRLLKAAEVEQLRRAAAKPGGGGSAQSRGARGGGAQRGGGTARPGGAGAKHRGPAGRRRAPR
jgi:23S rRNA pseudouridine2605 synthase